MQSTIAEDPVIRRMVEWAEAHASVRVVLLTSARTRPDAPVDLFSDYDVILAVTDVHSFFEDRSWLGDFGPVLVVYRDPLKRYYGEEKFAYITQYENGLKIDFTLLPVEILRRIVADPVLPPDLDVGYAVLLDKDGLTAGLQPPTYRAYILAPPDEGTYQTLIEEFFHEATYVAKQLWRDELLPAKYNLDQVMKQVYLRQMLEWRIEIDHDWSIKPGAYGKRLRKRLDPGLWSELESTYVGAGTEENWHALFATIALFRRVATQVGAHLGLAYPHELDRRVAAYLHKAQDLDRDAESFS